MPLDRLILTLYRIYHYINPNNTNPTSLNPNLNHEADSVSDDSFRAGIASVRGQMSEGRGANILSRQSPVHLASVQ